MSSRNEERLRRSDKFQNDLL